MILSAIQSGATANSGGGIADAIINGELKILRRAGRDGYATGTVARGKTCVINTGHTGIRTPPAQAVGWCDDAAGVIGKNASGRETHRTLSIGRCRSRGDVDAFQIRVTGAAGDGEYQRQQQKR